ncbi:MAG: glycosyltransferase family 2 protein [Prevotella sp.]|nr:glycosyltransferase family 2 protein [Prevotella sp.]
MKVSIIIPVYNVAPYIKRCLDSVAAQTYTGDMECLLVDDRGSDDSIYIAREWIASYTGKIRFTIFSHSANQGLSVARNTGIEVASGDYIYFLDSDDAITPDCIKILTDLAVKYPDADFVLGNINNDGVGLENHHFREIVPECVASREQLDYILLSATIYNSWNRLIKWSFIIRYGLFFPVGIVHEDVYWLFFLAKHTQKAAFTNEGTYYYYHNGDSIMNSKAAMASRIHSHGVIIDAFFKDLQLHGSTSTYQRQYFADAFINYMQLLVSFYSLSKWSSFWIRLLRMGWDARKKITLYRSLFFFCTMPPLCILTAFRWWRWRVRNYIIAKI